MEDLFKALGVFQQGVQEAAIAKGINDATTVVDQLRNNVEMDTQQKITAQKQVANQLMAQLSAAGAPASRIQSAAAGLMPEMPQTSRDAFALAQQTGDPYYMKMAKDMQGFEQAPQMEQMSRQQSFQSTEAEKDRAFRWQLAMAELGKTTAKEKKAGEVSFDVNVKQAKQFLSELKTTVSNFGTFESEWVGNSKAAAVLRQTPYQLAITYAKIVDPDSVAREGEVAAAQKYLINLGMMKNKKTALEEISRMEKTIDQYGENRAEASGRARPSRDMVSEPQQPVKIVRSVLNRNTGKYEMIEFDAKTGAPIGFASK
jgi:hypothetical protein